MIILNIPDIIIHVNDKLRNGYSIAKIERELGFGKDTLRKKLNRSNYWYDKTSGQFIFKDNTDTTQNITHTAKDEANTIKRHTEDVVITHDTTHKITHDNTTKNTSSENNNYKTQNITLSEKSPITQPNNTELTHQKSQRAITDEDFEILFEIIDNYKLKKNNISIPRNDADVTTRSFRSYKTVFDSFSIYCKDNELNQKDAIAEALISYMSK